MTTIIEKDTNGERRNHPGSGRRKAPIYNKGRTLDQTALDEVMAVLGERPRNRDLLIEFLHLIQDRYSCLSADHLQALAQEMRLPMAEVYEVATFYSHFDIVLDGETRPAPLTVRVCDSLTHRNRHPQGGLRKLKALHRISGQIHVPQRFFQPLF